MSIGHGVSMAKAFDHGMGKHIEMVPVSLLEGFLRVCPLYPQLSAQFLMASLGTLCIKCFICSCHRARKD
jgi:hypothetical protein